MSHSISVEDRRTLLKGLWIGPAFAVSLVGLYAALLILIDGKSPWLVVPGLVVEPIKFLWHLGKGGRYVATLLFIASGALMALGIGRRSRFLLHLGVNALSFAWPVALALMVIWSIGAAASP